MQNVLEGLNKDQYEAVINVDGPSLVIAGAGSGKTKVLTHKIAYMINEHNIAPWNILAITFTNKAANEMKSRIESIIGEKSKDLWMGTFHSVCVRILRKYIDRIGFDSSFVIFDAQDQRSVVKKCLKELNIDDKIFSDRGVVSEISKAKNEMLTPEQFLVRAKGDFRKEKIAEIYVLYQDKLKKSNSLDFDDIINYTIQIFAENPDCLEYYQDKFKYILVDEYQDTNKAQFTLITMLSAKHGNLTVVGDNDQGIYSFRGADITNILNFEKDFPGTKIIKLEQNYRSTKNILDTANSVIKNNKKKYEKNLWTEKEEGALPYVYQSDNEYDEASFIVEKIEHLKREEYYKYSDFAVLYRMNTQSRSIEDILRREDIPYQVIGGMKFYERKEVKDIIAYLRLIHNNSDNISLTRIINEPKRGIGKTSLEKIEMISNRNGISMYEAIKRADEFGLPAIFVNAKEFIQMIEEMTVIKEDTLVSELIIKVLEKSGYKKSLELEDTLESENRLENLNELLTVAIEFEEQFADNSVAEFLESVTLSSDIDDMEEETEKVTLMTLHSAKGLEFPAVFIVGMEEGIFPSYKSVGEPHELEEERRLCYVGITRAKDYLFLTCSKQRTIFGATARNKISRFITEISKELREGYDEGTGIEEDVYEDSAQEWQYGKSDKVQDKGHDNRYSGSGSQRFQYRTAESFLSLLNKEKEGKEIDLSKYRVGQTVSHKKFGIGVIEKIEPEGTDLKVDIAFEKAGKKRLMAKYADLEIIE